MWCGKRSKKLSTIHSTKNGCTLTVKNWRFVWLYGIGKHHSTPWSVGRKSDSKKESSEASCDLSLPATHTHKIMPQEAQKSPNIILSKRPIWSATPNHRKQHRKTQWTTVKITINQNHEIFMFVAENHHYSISTTSIHYYSLFLYNH